MCAAEERFLAAVLGGKVERTLHLLGGDAACQYKVRFPREGESAATESA
jgi:predicted ArsR family transcriptional regulator